VIGVTLTHVEPLFLVWTSQSHDLRDQKSCCHPRTAFTRPGRLADYYLAHVVDQITRSVGGCEKIVSWLIGHRSVRAIEVAHAERMEILASQSQREVNVT
jgi:hypothetical protein